MAKTFQAPYGGELSPGQKNLSPRRTSPRPSRRVSCRRPRRSARRVSRVTVTESRSRPSRRPRPTQRIRPSSSRCVASSVERPAAWADWEANMAKLTAAARKNIPKSQMAVPSKGKPKSKGGAVSGSYPIPDRAHAANALARSSASPWPPRCAPRSWRSTPTWARRRRQPGRVDDGNFDFEGSPTPAICRDETPAMQPANRSPKPDAVTAKGTASDETGNQYGSPNTSRTKREAAVGPDAFRPLRQRSRPAGRPDAVR